MELDGKALDPKSSSSTKDARGKRHWTLIFTGDRYSDVQALASRPISHTLRLDDGSEAIVMPHVPQIVMAGGAVQDFALEIEEIG